MPSFDELDAITIESLRATGATKWSRPDDSIGVFIAEMDFGIAPEITEALREEVDRGRFAYLPPVMWQDLQHALVDYLDRTQGWRVSEEWVYPLPDVVSAYRAVYRHFLTPGKKIILPTPTYMPFLTYAREEQVEVIEVPMLRHVDPETGRVRYENDLAGIEAAFEAGGELLVLCNPHNPTGRVFTRDDMRAITEVVDRHGGRVFSDEIWAPLVYTPHHHVSYASTSDAAAGHTITAIAASKGWNIPGLKCAQLIITKAEDRQHWETRGVGNLWREATANLGTVASVSAYRDAGDWCTDILRYLERNRDDLQAFFARRMPRARVTHPEGTYVAWIDFSDYGLPNGPQQFFAERAGVIGTEGSLSGEVGAGHVRFIFAMPHPVLMQALERMAAALDAFESGDAGGADARPGGEH